MTFYNNFGKVLVLRVRKENVKNLKKERKKRTHYITAAGGLLLRAVTNRNFPIRHVEVFRDQRAGEARGLREPAGLIGLRPPQF